jgi:hypothetical protein
MPAINAAVQALNDDPASGFTTPSGRGYHKSHECRTLTIHGVPVTAGGPTPSPEELRSILPPVEEVADAVSERMRLLEQEVRESRSTLTQQATIMDSLVRQAAAMSSLVRTTRSALRCWPSFQNPFWIMVRCPRWNVAQPVGTISEFTPTTAGLTD